MQQAEPSQQSAAKAAAVEVNIKAALIKTPAILSIDISTIYDLFLKVSALLAMDETVARLRKVGTKISAGGRGS